MGKGGSWCSIIDGLIIHMEEGKTDLCFTLKQTNKCSLTSDYDTFIHCDMFLSWTTIQSESEWITVYPISTSINLKKGNAEPQSKSQKGKFCLKSFTESKRKTKQYVFFRHLDAFVKLWGKTKESLKLNLGKPSLQGSRGMWPIGSM